MHHSKIRLEKPTNQHALVIYLLLERGKKGINTFEAIKDCYFYKITARVSELISKYELNVHKKQEKFTNRFGHKGQTTRYCLYESDLQKNLDIYKKVNSKK